MKTNTLETPSGRVIFIRAPKRLTKAQIAQALGSLPDDDPRWLAVHQLVDEQMAAAMFDSSSPDLSDSKVRHAGGRVEALATLKQSLYDARKAPLQPEPDPGRRGRARPPAAT